MHLHTRTLALLLIISSPASAQRAWKAIGTTSTGNTVYVDPRGVKRSGGLVTADVRVVFNTPVQSPQGTWASTRTAAMFDCAKQSVAVKENIVYADAKGTRVTQRHVNKIPGYGPALGGSPTAVAMGYLCAR